jgi:VCBS repeat-containing protein
MSAKGRRGTQATSSLLVMSPDGVKGSTLFSVAMANDAAIVLTPV